MSGPSQSAALSGLAVLLALLPSVTAAQRPPDPDQIRAALMLIRESPSRALEVGRYLRGVGPEAIPVVTAELHSPEPLVQWSALVALGAMGSSAASAAHAVLPLLGHPNETVAERAAETLGQMGVEALPALREAARSGDPRVRELAEAAADVIARAEGATTAAEDFGSMFSGTPLHEGVRRGEVDVTAEGAGGYSTLLVTVRNRRPEWSEYVLPGTYFAPSSTLGSRSQREAVGRVERRLSSTEKRSALRFAVAVRDETTVIRLAPGESAVFEMRAFCLDGPRASPGRGEPYRVVPSPLPPVIRDAVEAWASDPSMPQGAAQSRIWSLRREHDLGRDPSVEDQRMLDELLRTDTPAAERVLLAGGPEYWTSAALLPWLRLGAGQRDRDRAIAILRRWLLGQGLTPADRQDIVGWADSFTRKDAAEIAGRSAGPEEWVMPVLEGWLGGSEDDVARVVRTVVAWGREFPRASALEEELMAEWMRSWSTETRDAAEWTLRASPPTYWTPSLLSIWDSTLTDGPRVGRILDVWRSEYGRQPADPAEGGVPE